MSQKRQKLRNITPTECKEMRMLWPREQTLILMTDWGGVGRCQEVTEGNKLWWQVWCSNNVSLECDIDATVNKATSRYLLEENLK